MTVERVLCRHMEKILVTRPSLPPFQEFVAEIRGLWDSRILTNMGRKHQEFEERLRAYLGVGNLSLMVNGHMALELALQAMGLSGEVITTPFTFASTAHAIVRNGLTPIFCDIEKDTFTLDASKIEALITEKTTAIVPVHVYGNLCAIEQIDEIAKKRHLKVIYDAAHAFGESYHGQGAGQFGDASIFSFHATKVFHSVEGGAVCYQDPKLGDVLYGLKNFGIRGPETVELPGANAKMNELQAAMGICNLRHVDGEITKRKDIYERYEGRLRHIPGIQLMRYREGIQSNYAYFPIVVHEGSYGATRDQLMERLASHGIYCRKYFYPLASAYGCYQGKWEQHATPVAEFIAKRVLTLPIYADLRIEDVDRICDILSWKGQGNKDGRRG